MSAKKENVRKIIKKTIQQKELISEGEHIVIGLSGGPDSVCLFHVLCGLREELGFSLYAVHVNHLLRPGDAEQDREYAEKLCADAGVLCFSFVCDCGKWAEEHGVSGEEAGRIIRYEKFLQTARKISAEKGVPADKVGIAVAQNSRDQAETVLFRLLRGTGPDGLAGIAYKRYEREIKVIRPLLDVSREEIEAYCAANGLKPRIDRTNLEPIFARNKIRLSLIPYLQREYNENIVDTVNRLSKIAAQDKDYLWREAENAYRQAGGCGELDLKKLAALHPAIRHRVILRAFADIGLAEDIGAVHLEAADEILSRPQPSKTAEFPKGFKMVIGYGTVRFAAPGAFQNGKTEKEKQRQEKSGGGESGGERANGGKGKNERGKQEKTKPNFKGSGKPGQEIFPRQEAVQPAGENRREKSDEKRDAAITDESREKGNTKEYIKYINKKEDNENRQNKADGEGNLQQGAEQKGFGCGEKPRVQQRQAPVRRTDPDGNAEQEKRGAPGAAAEEEYRREFSENPKWILKVRTADAGEEIPPGSAAFDRDKISAVYPEITGQIRLRIRMPGDYIKFKNGRKKLQNFFVDQKIPREERDLVPIAAAGSEILWLPALPGTPLKRHRYSTNYGIDEQTKKILTLEIICVT